MVETSAPVTFGAYFSVKETSVFSFDDVVLSKGGFLDNKNVNACERLEVSEHIRKHTQVCLDLNPFLYR